MLQITFGGLYPNDGTSPVFKGKKKHQTAWAMFHSYQHLLISGQQFK
jgi:hypothetical protein